MQRKKKTDLTSLTRKLYAAAAVAAVLAPLPVYASDPAEAKWAEFIDFIFGFLLRGGVLVIVVGGIIFALALNNNEPDKKIQGLLTCLAGFILAAIGGFAPGFLQ
jgi:hypothetical protein